MKAFIDWEVIKEIIKDREGGILRQAQANKKKCLKKIIELTIINADTWDTYREELMNNYNRKRKNIRPKND